MQEIKAIIAGFGGQGVLFAGKVLSQCGMIDDRYLSWLPSYGPEMRGGTCNCSVTISDRAIGSPLVIEPNILIAMNQPSFDKFYESVVEGGLIVVDSGLVPDIKEREGVKVCRVNAANLAEESGLKGLGNIVLIGKLFEELQFCSFETIEAAIKKCCPAKKPEMVGYNMKALEIGRKS